MGTSDSKAEFYIQSVELNLQDTKAYNDRGFVYDNLRQYRKVIENYTKTIELLNGCRIEYKSIQQYKYAIYKDNRNKSATCTCIY